MANNALTVLGYYLIDWGNGNFGIIMIIKWNEPDRFGDYAAHWFENGLITPLENTQSHSEQETRNAAITWASGKTVMPLDDLGDYPVYTRQNGRLLFVTTEYDPDAGLTRTTAKAVPVGSRLSYTGAADFFKYWKGDDAVASSGNLLR